MCIIFYNFSVLSAYDNVAFENEALSTGLNRQKTSDGQQGKSSISGAKNGHITSEVELVDDKNEAEINGRLELHIDYSKMSAQPGNESDEEEDHQEDDQTASSSKPVINSESKNSNTAPIARSRSDKTGYDNVDQIRAKTGYDNVDQIQAKAGYDNVDNIGAKNMKTETGYDNLDHPSKNAPYATVEEKTTRTGYDNVDKLVTMHRSGYDNLDKIQQDTSGDDSSKTGYDNLDIQAKSASKSAEEETDPYEPVEPDNTEKISVG